MFDTTQNFAIEEVEAAYTPTKWALVEAETVEAEA